MPRTPEQSRRWVDEGTALFTRALEVRADDQLDGPTSLAGWTGRHLLAHVAANADALVNLIQWAETGEETPMYSSPQQRNADIEAGVKRPAGELREWFTTSAQSFAQRYDALTMQQRVQEVRTAQGRTVPASEVTWMRSREVMVHAVDLSDAVTFADLPTDFLVALVEDIVGKRSQGGDGPSLRLTATDTGTTVEINGLGDPIDVTGPLPEIATYLSGRPGFRVTTGHRASAPELPNWL